MSLARRSLQVVAFICTLVVGAASMAVIVTQTTWFKEWLRGFIVRQAEDYVNGRLSIGRLDGNLFFGVELEDVDITQNGQTVVGMKDVGVDYNAFTLIRGDVVLDSIRVNQPVLLAKKTADGWNLAHLIKARTPDRPRNRPTLEISEIGISDGTVMLEGDVVGTSGTLDAPSRIGRLDLSAAVTSNEDELKVSINHLSLRAEDPAVGLNELAGVVRRTRDGVQLDNVTLRTEETSLSIDGSITTPEHGAPVVDLHASSEKFDTDEIGRLLPALRGYQMQPVFNVTAKGPLDGMAVKVNGREKKLGKVDADLTVDIQAPARRIAGAVAVEHFNVGPLAKSQTLKSDITGKGRVDLNLPEGHHPLSGTYAVTASSVTVAGYAARNVKAEGRLDGLTFRFDASANAYGGAATARGTVVAGQRVALDLQGHATNVDMRNLPPTLRAPKVPSNLQFDYTLTGRGPTFSGTVLMDQSTLADATIAPGTTGMFRFGDGAPSYSAQGHASGIDLQKIGHTFQIAALDVDRYRSQINAEFDVTGSGGGRYPLTLDATGTVTDSQLFDASFPRLNLTANLAAGDAHFKATGQFASLNPAKILGDERFAGELGGVMDVDTTIRGYADQITVDSVDVSGRVNLANSKVGELAIDTGVVEGNIAHRAGTLTQLSIVGPDVNIAAHGPVALDETGMTDLTLHVEAPMLERIGALLKQPLMGGAVVDATVTGNARQLNAHGTLKGSNIGYADNNALSLDTTFDATVPDLTVANATVKTSNMATFLEAGGLQINEVKLDATYANSEVTFDATARQPMRELQAGGRLVLHPDHQEVHLSGVTLTSGTVQWALAPGGEATIQYDRDRITVKDVRLVSGDQTITADGVVGSPQEQLRVRAENVDVAQANALLLTDQPMEGRLTADAIVSGPITAPTVAADFTLTGGSFRMFTFQSLGGKVDYAKDGVTLDVRLEQDPRSWFTAKGYAPLTLFRANPEGMSDDHDESGAGGNVDLEIASSQIDLGVIQGFTSYVTDVTGTLQTNLRVTGTGYDPHVTGTVDVEGGTFSVPELGAAFTGLDTHIELTPDLITVSRMQVWDEHGQPLNIGGTLGVHERNVGAVDITLTSDEFEIIHNDLGRLKLDSDLRFTGEVRAPRLEGSVGVHTGTLNVAELLNRVTGGPYATSAANLGPAAPMPEMPGGFAALDLNIALTIPSNLVLNGQNIRPANSPIEIGDMSATVGGTVQIRKPPGEMLRVSGEVTTVRGNYSFQGRRFEIQRDGRIRFDGGEMIDPLLDVRASRVISGVEAVVRIQGTMRAPEISFSSNPPLDQADILSLIVFNQPINELGEGQQVSLTERAAGLAGGYLASGLSTSIRSALSLDEFQIQASSDLGGPELTIGEQIGDNLFFRLRQGFGVAQATELMLEYQIREFLRVQATAADTQANAQRVGFRRIERGGIDLIFFFNY